MDILLNVKTFEIRFPIKTTSNIKIMDLKTTIAKEKGFDPSKMLIVFKGLILKDNSTIEENKVTSNSYIILLFKKEKSIKENKLFNEKEVLNLVESLKQQYPVHLLEPKLPEIKKEDIMYLLEAGFEESLCKKALYLNDLNPEKALEWIVNNLDNPQLATPLTKGEISKLALKYNKKLQIKSPGIDNCIKDGKCTRAISGKNYLFQSWYCCFTCGITDHQGVCESCAVKCHKGHQLSEPNFGSFFCDCLDANTCTLLK